MLQRNNHRKKKAQVSIEFAFCMVVMVMLIYALAMVLRWAGMSFIERDRAHEATLPDVENTAGFYVPSDPGFTLPDVGMR